MNKSKPAAAALLLTVALLTACTPTAVPDPPGTSTSTATTQTVTHTNTATETTTTTTTTTTGTFSASSTAASASASTTASSSASSTDPAAPRTATVERLIDGDTIVLSGGERVRVIGIDTPEISSPVQCYGPEALVNAEEILPVGSTVQLTPDPSQGSLDRYGRTLAYVSNEEGGDFGLAQIQGGYAREYTYTKSRPYVRQGLYLAEQNEAKNIHAGLWGSCPA